MRVPTFFKVGEYAPVYSRYSHVLTVYCWLFYPLPRWGDLLPGFGVVGALYSTSCVSYDSHATTTKHAAAALTVAQKPHHDESVLVAFLDNPPRIRQ